MKHDPKNFPHPDLYGRDVVYCDAAFFSHLANKVIIGIVYRDQVTRIQAKAKNGTIAELLAILMARKLYPGKLIVNDCKAVTDMFTEGRDHSLRHMLGKDAKIDFLMQSINDFGGVVWMRRRSDDLSCLVDSLTRKTLTRNLEWRLENNGFKIAEYGF